MDGQLPLFDEIPDKNEQTGSPQESNRKFCTELEEDLTLIGFLECHDTQPQPQKYIKRAAYQDMYGSTRHSTFLIHHKIKGLLRVEAHRQVQSGSVDQKFPFFYESLNNAPEETVVIVFDGKGYKKEAFDWLLNQTEIQTNKMFKVFASKDGFLNYLAG
ncbi:PD-(D/E)XK nuclease superfamily protein [Pseudoalteromonas sp. Ld20]|uniref:PD-(D/E)XK nuclease superfamily protein n=1 Tax=Pseudoalteromonas sp. Ld20 TaxID=649165 RepID=UPI00386BBE85